MKGEDILLNVKVSIIIPIYNTEEYLRRCVDSCINQTLKEIEIILVNDASPDNSGIIMKEYGEKYPNIIRNIYLEKNVGLGGARNIGFEQARGEYITFVDSDDWIRMDMCEVLYNKAMENGAELVQGDAAVENEDGYRASTVLSEELTKIDKEDAICGLLFERAVSACGKIVKRELILNRQLFFTPGMYAEDTAVTKLWYLYANRISKVDEAFYMYCFNADSIGHYTMLDYRDDWFRAVRILHDGLLKFDERNKYHDEIQVICLYYTLSAVQTMLRRTKERFLKETTTDLRRNIDKIGFMENKYFRFLFTLEEINLFRSGNITKYKDAFTDTKKQEDDYESFYFNLKPDIKKEIEDRLGIGLNLGIWSKTSYAKGFHKVFKNMPLVDSLEDIKKYKIKGIVLLRTAHYANVKNILSESGKDVKLLDLPNCFWLGNGSN